jgi:hypothetical protein
MGILKHVVLPAFALVHAASLYACKDLKTWGALVGLVSETEVTESDVASIRQNHMLGALRGFNLALLGLCGYGIFAKSTSSDCRQAIALAETALFSVATVDAYRLGGLNYFVPAAHSFVALGGYLVSLMEPGIFTKDHSKK